MLSLNARRALFRASTPLLIVAAGGCSDDTNSSPGTNGPVGGTTSSSTGTSSSTTSSSTANTAAGPTTTGSATGTVGTTTGSTTTTSGATGTPGATGVGGATGTATSTGGTVTGTVDGSTGTATASSSSVSTGAGGSGGGTSTAVLTDDFESVAAGSAPDSALWQLRVPPGSESTIAVTSEQFHGGAQSVKVVGASGSTMFYTTNVFPLPNGVVYFRVWMRFSDANWANHNAFVEASPGAESQEVRFGGQANAYHANLAAAGDGLSPNPYEQPSCTRCLAPVADTWQCLRGKFDFAGNAAELYVGDTLAVDSAADGWHSGDGTFPQSPTEIGFGWALYGAMPNTVYYDDLAIGYEPLGCE